MGLREIPALSVLCLRVVGSPKCKVDETFAPTKDGKPSSASRLLRSFHNRPVLGCGETMNDYFESEKEAIQALNNDDNDKENNNVVTVPTLERIPMKRMPAIGPGSGRRKQANDVDLNHPWIGTYLPMVSKDDDDEKENEIEFKTTDEGNNNADNIPSDPQEQTLVAGSGCCALDLLQCYIDALVEMGRMDDTRLGLQFFAEFKTNIELHYKSSLAMGSLPDASEAATTNPVPEELPPPAPAPVMDTPIPKKKKRKRSSGGAFSAAKKKKEAEARAAAEAKKQAAILAAVPKSRGSLGLHNCCVLTNTTSNLLTSRLLEHIHVLDLTGLQTLTDGTLLPLLKSSGLQLERLSLKNCRRLTDITIHSVCENCPNLKAIDFGGDYNIEPRTLLDALAVKVTKRGRGIFTSQALQKLVELHAGGIGSTGGWTDHHLPELFAMRGWKALSIGFSPYLTFAGWKEALLSVEQTHKEEEEQAQADTTSNNNKKNTNMCQTLQSLGIAFCEQQLVDNAWLGLVGRHLPNLRALDVRGNHHLHSMTSWYDGRATIGHAVHPKQSLVVLARYSGISVNGIEETKRIYPLAAAPLRVVTESDGIGWGILRQEQQQASPEHNKHKHHYQYRLAAAKQASKEKAKALEAAKATPEASATESKIVAVVVPPEEDPAPEIAPKEASSTNNGETAVAMETTD